MKKSLWNMEMAAFIMILVLCIVLSGCGKANEKESNAEISGVRTEAAAVRPDEEVYKEDEERHEAWRMRRMQMPQSFQTAYDRFATVTAAEIFQDENENQVYSPMSLYYALALAASGAEGETREELLQVLGYEDIETLSEDCRLSFEAFYHVPNEKNNKANEWGEFAQEGRYTLKPANSLWADESLKLKAEFAKNGAENFYADIFTGDYQSEEMQKAKSLWVKEQTNGVIEPEPGNAGQGELLSIINTIYFYDEWVTRFDKEKTKEDIFTCADGEHVACDFMNMHMGSHGFWRGENYTASSLSLKNGTMTFYLPHEGTEVHELVQDADAIDRLLNGEREYCSGEVTWKIPKFSYGTQISAAEALNAMGVEKAFESDADFSGISDANPLFINRILQNAHIGIDEDGVEGAAFTEIMFAGAALPTDRADMILDRPFLYTVENFGRIVFLGICGNPAEQN